MINSIKKIKNFIATMMLIYQSYSSSKNFRKLRPKETKADYVVRTTLNNSKD